jgi:hypothetical protein
MIKIKDIRDGYNKIIKQRDTTNEFNFANNRVTGMLHEAERMREKGDPETECIKKEKEAMQPLVDWYTSHPSKSPNGQPLDFNEYGGLFMKYNLRKKKSKKISSKRKKCSCKKK